MNVPERLLSVSHKLKTGDLRSGLNDLRRIYDDSRTVDRLLKAEFLLGLGDMTQAEGLVRSVLSTRVVLSEVKARGLEHLGYLTRHAGRTEEAVRIWAQSIHIAEKSGDLEQVCRSQLHLLSAKADLYGMEALGTLPSDVHQNVTRLGDPHLWLMLHWRFAEIESRRGTFASATSHIALATSILERHPNTWIEARLCLLHGAIAETLSRFDESTTHFQRALDIARTSGLAFVEMAALSNLGHSCVSSGRFELAREYLNQAQSLTNDWQSFRFAVTESFARLELFEGRYDQCEQLLSHVKPPERASLYMELENSLTKILLLKQRGDLTTALALAESGATVAASREASVLQTKFRLMVVDVLIDLERLTDARLGLGQIQPAVGNESLSLLAEFERVKGRLSARLGYERTARGHFARASRLLNFVGDAASRHQLARTLENDWRPNSSSADISVADQQSIIEHPVSLDTVSAVARVLDFCSQPVLLGQEVLWLLQEGSALERAALVSTHEGERNVVQSLNWSESELENADDVVRIGLGHSNQVTHELLVQVAQRDGATELLHLLKDLVTKATELDLARRERTQRTSLWPSDAAIQVVGPVFCSETMREVKRQALRMAETDLKILITGETGVGKEILARLIHESSRRSSKRFEAVNCAAVPRELFEAHLFGHRKGAFTGAIADAPGVIRGNDGGTIFLDEIGELSLDMQVKLLRVLDANEIHPLGATQAVHVDFRVIAATNANLLQLIEERRFRDDLFYRLNVVTLRIPPLRERRDEILPLAQYFLNRFATENSKPVLELSDETKEYLLLYNWTGNIRELRNEMERLAGLLDGGVIVRPTDLKSEIVASCRAKPDSTELGPHVCVVRLDQKLQDAFDHVAKLAIIYALKRNDGNLENTAKDLGLTRKGLYNKRLRYSLL